jgi:DNA repair protein RecO (recombination protein O)
MIKTEAIILKVADLNETGRILTIFSEKLGKVSVRAIGVKKLDSKLRYSIESISYCQIILVEGKNFLILKDAVLLDQFLGIKESLIKLRTSKELADFIDEAVVGQEKDEDIWDLILLTFKTIDKADCVYVKTLPKLFKNSIIALLGYNPDEMKELRDIY